MTDVETLRAAKAIAIERAGGPTKLARELGVSRQAIHLWKKIPVEHVKAIAAITGLPTVALRPDLIELMKG